MSRSDPQMNLRFPPDLKARLVEEARRNGRTMGAEIIHRLRASLDMPQAQRFQEQVEKAVFEALEMLRDIHKGVKSPPPPPQIFGKKRTAKNDPA